MSQQQQMTHTCGYYNGERWPIQLVISKFNITLTLKAGEYILDRSGRKINDPYFDLFVQNKQLRREESDKPVPLITVPVVTVATPMTTQQANPVRAVTQWMRDKKGVRQPVLTQPEPPPPQPLPEAVVATASDSVRPMTMEEARRAGFVRRVREVPEEYGANDTTGLPPANIPRMKVAIDPSMNKAATPLPKEMLRLPANDPNRQARSQIVAGLAQSAKAPPADTSSSPFGNAGVVNSSPLMAGVPAQIQESEAPTDVEPSEPEPLSEQEPELQVELQEQQPVVALPEPDLQELEEMEAQDPPPPLPVAPKLTQPKVPLKPLTPANKFTCIACGAPFKFRSQLLNHAKAKHADRLNAIMASYPETSASS